MKRALLLIGAVALLFILVMTTGIQAAEGDLIWSKTCGGSSIDFSMSIIPSGDGGFLTVGQTASYGAGNWDIWLVKVNAQGDTIWTQTYGGPGADWAYNIIPYGGGFLMVGGTSSYGAGSYDIFLLKINSQGDSLWSHTYGGPGHDSGASILPSGDGGLLLLGNTNSYGAGDFDLYLMKLNAQGDSVWAHTYGGAGLDVATSLIPSGDGAFLVGGCVTTPNGGNGKMYLMKVSGSGNTIWEHTYGGPNDNELYSITPSGDGGFLLAGWTGTFGTGNQDISLVKVDEQGDSLWNQTYGGANDDIATSIIASGDGGFLLAGWTYSFGSGTEDDVYLVKVNAQGALLGEYTYGGTGIDEAYSIIPAGDGGFLLVGSTDSFGVGDGDTYLLKVQGPPALTIVLSPVNPPVQIPANGGSFLYSVNVRNVTSQSHTFQIWNRIKKPNGQLTPPVFGPATRTLPGGANVTRMQSQTIASNYPPGVSTYISYVGSYPSTIVDSSFFNFTKSTAADGGTWISESTCEGDLFDESGEETINPERYSLSQNYPDPFNPSTTISYELRAACFVNLSIYDVTGKKVTELVNGTRDAGSQEVTFDGSKLASGIYIYRIEAGEYSAVRKMVMVK